jgi:hypothetical protein
MVTNQPYPGHQIAGWLSKKGEKYESFPHCYERRNIKIFGGDWRFLTRKFKKGDLAVKKVSNWMVEETGSLPKGDVVFVGDKQGDIDFSGRLAASLRGEHNFSGEMIWGVTGFLLSNFLSIVFDLPHLKNISSTSG